MKIDTVFKNRDIVVVNKISGIHSHPLKVDETSTMLHLVSGEYKEVLQPMNADRPLEGGLLHRLDEGTSGALAFARSQSGFVNAKKTWKGADSYKIYLAWVYGGCHIKGAVSGFISHSEKSKKKMVFRFKEISKVKCWSASTELMPVDIVFHDDKIFTLMLVRIHTGITHQIRCTLATLGYPVVADLMYKNKKKMEDSLVTENIKHLKNQTLNVFLELKDKIKCITVPDESKLSSNQFMLHSYYLKTPVINDGGHGILALPPEYFRLKINL